MTYYFTKAKTSWGDEYLIVFEQGCIGKPICLLNKDAVERLNKEWKLKNQVAKK